MSGDFKLGPQKPHVIPAGQKPTADQNPQEILSLQKPIVIPKSPDGPPPQKVTVIQKPGAASAVEIVKTLPPPTPPTKERPTIVPPLAKRTVTRNPLPKTGHTVVASLSVSELWGRRHQVWKQTKGVVVSAVLSIHNRSKLFNRALFGYLWQTMPPDKWEIILLDDMSTEDLSLTYKPFIGKMNIRHVKVDHTRHPMWKKKNPHWRPGGKENWYHTPAITINMGFYLARGPVICLCHPEILHAPENFERAAIRIMAEENVFLFGTTYLGTRRTNDWLDKTPQWTKNGWHGFMNDVEGEAMSKFKEECYWYTSFLPRAAAGKTGGVDFDYLKGVAGEDDDFRERVRIAGYQPVHAPELMGLHQDHGDEKERHRRRDTDEWYIGLETNRATYYRRRVYGFPQPANRGYDWTGKECFVMETRYRVGIDKPEIVSVPVAGIHGTEL
jgi:glycosyltransferase involved in cell wall biosynthesis